MAKIHLCNFVEIRHWIVPNNSINDNGSWQTQQRWQNGNNYEPIEHDGHKWGFLSFIYNGATRTRTGDNIESSLLVASNQISMDHAYDIVVIDYNKNQQHVKRQIKVETCLLNDDFTKTRKTLSREYWIGGSMGYNDEAVEIQLSSAIDAVFNGMPNMYLTEANVGRLPTTARVSTS